MTVCVGPTPEPRSIRVCVRMMLKTAWDLLLSSFIFVAATVRDLLPSDIRHSMSCREIERGGRREGRREERERKREKEREKARERERERVVLAGLSNVST